MKPPLISDFSYHLPPELIAQVPAARRQDSGLMVVNRAKGSIEDKRFVDLKEYLNKGDALVLNDTRVIPARLFGRKKDTGGRVEVFLVMPVNEYSWQVLLRPARGLKEGSIIEFEEGLEALCRPFISGRLRQVEFNKPKKGLLRLIKKIGFYPVPPYIKRNIEDKRLFKALSALDRRRYQTVYAKKDGAVAAPTAGLHFSRAILNQLRMKGVEILYVTLHTGYGTFRPLREEDLEESRLHPEYYAVSAKTLGRIDRVKKAGGKITVVGTTACRALETAALNTVRQDGENIITPENNANISAPLAPAERDVEGWTDLFIYPLFDFKITDMLLTNFHLPGTSLLMLVSAFCGGGNLWRRAYERAIERKYRFYSYGDAMFIH